MDSNRPAVHLFFGVLLGTSIGLADGVLGLNVWLMLDRPDFLIRRSFEGLHIIALTFCGAVAGILYGAILAGMTRRYGRRPPLGFVYAASVAISIPIFFCANYLIVANRVPCFFMADLLVFALALGVARHVVRRGNQLSQESEPATDDK